MQAETGTSVDVEPDAEDFFDVELFVDKRWVMVLPLMYRELSELTKFYLRNY